MGIYIEEQTITQSEIIVDSYKKYTNDSLISGYLNPLLLSRELYYHEHPILSHNTLEDPIFNYANVKAQELFEMDWEIFINTPSRLSAPEQHWVERSKLIKGNKTEKITHNYEGVRISSSGKLFHIRNTSLWTLENELGEFCGQAAIIREVEYL